MALFFFFFGGGGGGVAVCSGLGFGFEGFNPSVFFNKALGQSGWRFYAVNESPNPNI